MVLKTFNSAHRENLCFIQFSKRIYWNKSLTDLLHILHNHLSSIHSIVRIKKYRCLNRVIHEIDKKNERLLFKVTFAANLGWFLSRQRKTLCLRCFILKSTGRAWILLKNTTRDFQNSPPFERCACFYVTITENFKGIQYFNFETNSLKNENLFQKLK